MVPIMKDKLSKIQYIKDPEIWDNISTIRDRMYHSNNDNMKVIINRNEMLMDKFSMRGLWSIEESKHVKAVMKGITDHVIHEIDMRRLIIDSGSSTHASGSIRDFKINSMKVLKILSQWMEYQEIYLLLIMVPFTSNVNVTMERKK